MIKENRIKEMVSAEFDGESLRCPICSVTIDFYNNEEECIYGEDSLVGKILKCRNGHLCKEMVE